MATWIMHVQNPFNYRVGLRYELTYWTNDTFPLTQNIHYCIQFFIMMPRVEEKSITLKVKKTEKKEIKVKIVEFGESVLSP